MIFQAGDAVRDGLFSPVRADPDFGKSTPLPGQSPIGVDEAVAIADKIFPDGRLHWILLPSAPSGVYVVGKQSDDEPNRTKTFRNVGVDQVQRQGSACARSQWLHRRREIPGMAIPAAFRRGFRRVGRSIVLVVGLTPLVLYVTGFLRWRQKRRARRRASILTNPFCSLCKALIIARRRSAFRWCPRRSSPRQRRA